MNVSFWMPLGLLILEDCLAICSLWRITDFQTLHHSVTVATFEDTTPKVLEGYDLNLRSMCAMCNCFCGGTGLLCQEIVIFIMLFLCYFCFTMLFTLGCKNI